MNTMTAMPSYKVCDPYPPQKPNDGLDKKFLFKLILAEVNSTDPKCGTMIEGSLEDLWKLSESFNGCDRYYNYLYTKLQSIQLIMGCYVRQIDTKDGRSEMSTSSKTRKDENINAQGQSTNSSVSFSDSIGKNKFDDHGESKTTYMSTTTGRGWSYNYTDNLMTDKSYSSNSASSTTDGTQRTYRENTNTSTTDGESTSGSFNASCTKDADSKISKGKMYSGSAFLSAVVGHTGSVGSGFSSKKMAGSGYKKGWRDGDTTRYVYGNVDNETKQNGTSRSWSQQVWNDDGWSRGAFDQWQKTLAWRRMTAHSEGFGTSQDEFRGRDNSSAQGTNESKKILNALVTSNKNGFSVMDDISAHQRFDHINTLYKNTERELKDYQIDLTKGLRPVSGKILERYLGKCPQFEILRSCACPPNVFEYVSCEKNKKSTQVSDCGCK